MGTNWHCGYDSEYKSMASSWSVLKALNSHWNVFMVSDHVCHSDQRLSYHNTHQYKNKEQHQINVLTKNDIKDDIKIYMFFKHYPGFVPLARAPRPSHSPQVCSSYHQSTRLRECWPVPYQHCQNNWKYKKICIYMGKKRKKERKSSSARHSLGYLSFVSGIVSIDRYFAFHSPH